MAFPLFLQSEDRIFLVLLKYHMNEAKCIFCIFFVPLGVPFKLLQIRCFGPCIGSCGPRV